MGPVNADRNLERAPVENGTFGQKLLGALSLVHWRRRLGPPRPGLGVMEPVALAFGLDDLAGSCCIERGLAWTP